MQPVIRLAAEADAAAIVAVIRQGFDPDLLARTIYGCRRVEHFVAGQIGAYSIGGETSFTVAVDPQGIVPQGIHPPDIVGCAELRSIHDGLFLNYISVAPGRRGRGVAARLLAGAIEAARQPGQRQLHLDVLAHNESARAWYERLGCQRVSESAWWQWELQSGDHAPATIGSWPQAEACQQAFGFSQFVLRTEQACYTVGRLGDALFRITDVNATLDPRVSAALNKIDASRQVLAVLPQGALPVELARRAELIAVHVRMTGSLDVILHRLSHAEARP